MSLSFLLAHLGHHLKSIPNKTDEYSHVIRDYQRFMDAEIDRIVYESKQRRLFYKQERIMDRSLGQLQVNVLKKMLEEEASIISQISTHTAQKLNSSWVKKTG